MRLKNTSVGGHTLAGNEYEIPPLPDEVEWTSHTSRFYNAWNPRPSKLRTIIGYCLAFAGMQTALFANAAWGRGIGVTVLIIAVSDLARWGGNHWKGFAQGWMAHETFRELIGRK